MKLYRGKNESSKRSVISGKGNVKIIKGIKEIKH